MRAGDKFVEKRTQVLVLVVSLVVSVLSGLLPDWLKSTFTTADQVLFGAVVFAIFILFDLLLVLAISAQHQIEAHSAWKLRSKGDVLLANIRASLFQIAGKAYGEKDLFVSHFENQLAALEEKIRMAAEKQELRAEEDHALSVGSVLASLVGDTEQIYRFTWEIEDNVQLFEDINLRLYFEVAGTMLQAHSMKEVRVIMVVNDFSVLQSPRLAKLLDFFHTNSGFACRIVQANDHEKLCEGNGILSDYNEVGIFGNRLLFLTEEYEPTSGTIGVFSKDENRIRRYKNFFDTVWAHVSVAERNPSKASNRVSFEELIKFDRNPTP